MKYCKVVPLFLFLGYKMWFLKCRPAVEFPKEFPRVLTAAVLWQGRISLMGASVFLLFLFPLLATPGINDQSQRMTELGNCSYSS